MLSGADYNTMLKKTICITYAIIIITMATATIIEKCEGTEYAASAIYGSWWFTALWALLAAAGFLYIIRCRVRRPAILTLHASFGVILAGALLTHLTAWQGTLHLRMNRPDTSLPFTVTLKAFEVRCHEGTNAPYDYMSRFIITDDGESTEGMVSMNNIFSYRGYRLFQSSYDDDMMGSTLSVNSDPWGIPVTYLGYAMLFVALVWMLIEPRGRFRKVLDVTAKAMALPLAMAVVTPALAANTVSKEDAARLARLNINYNDRICPLETFALDFTKSIAGARGYGGYNAVQVLAGFALFSDEWMEEPVIRVKSAELRERLGIGEHASAASFFNAANGKYRLGPYVQEYYKGSNDAFHKAAAEVDEKLMLIMQVRGQVLMKMFPYRGVWYSPADKLPATMVEEQQGYVRSALPVLAMLVHGGITAQSEEMIGKMLKYQYRYGGNAIPSPLRLEAERIYNALPYTTMLFIACLTLGLASVAWRRKRLYVWGTILLLLFLTLFLALRWLVSGRVPMANGYETMLTMAWAVLAVALLLRRRFQIIITFGLLLAGFFLLVSHLSQMNPQINHVMPVLQSPLLAVHVSVIMAAYALLSITAACAVVALASRKRAEAMTQLSVLMLYPAMACLGMGIFVGAIWANVSWGTYWSWDPKETWALITFMLYAVPLHRVSLPQLGNHRAYHIYTLCSFASVVVTYFGVNYLLGGMHSYA